MSMGILIGNAMISRLLHAICHVNCGSDALMRGRESALSMGVNLQNMFCMGL